MKEFKPNLAGIAEPEHLVLPVFASTKFDGVRATVMTEGVRSRKLLEFPNPSVQQFFSAGALRGLDGEFVLRGMEVKPGCFSATSGALARQHGTPDMVFHVFDDFLQPNRPFTDRYADVLKRVETLGPVFEGRVVVVPQVFCMDLPALLEFEEVSVDAGWEGVMVRSPEGTYKFGRSTMNEGGLLKFKRFADSEAEVLEVIEQMTNLNPAEKDAFGRTKRSTKKEGLVPAGTLGSFRSRDIYSGVEFSCSPGVLKQVEADALWAIRKQLLGRVFKYRFQKVGVKDKPRFPRFQGWREGFDL